MGFNYILFVDFRESRRDVLYEGESYYKKDLIDYIRVARHQIAIRFVRANRIDTAEYMFTLQSPVRFQMYRAVCFYLAVTGELPEVKRIRMVSDAGTVELNPQRLARRWENCSIRHTLDAETAGICFGEHGKTCYIALTYFLKAQLDIFPLDAFRAAWSGLNVLYSQLCPDGTETDKLNKLDELMREQKLKLSVRYTMELPFDFWRHVKWGMLLGEGNRHRDEMIIKIENNNYADRVIYQYLSSAYIKILKKENKKEEAEQFAELSKTRIRGKKANHKQQLRFLVTEYCYLLRNHSFHAAEPYPVFSLFDDSTKGEREYLTELLLILISELIPIICGNNEAETKQ